MSFRTISALEGLIIHPSPDLDNDSRKNADTDAPTRSGCDVQGAAAHSGAERKEVQSCSRRRSDGDILISRGAAVRGAGVGRKLRGSLGAALAMIGEEDGEVSDPWGGAARGRGDVSLQPRKGKRKMSVSPRVAASRVILLSVLHRILMSNTEPVSLTHLFFRSSHGWLGIAWETTLEPCRKPHNPYTACPISMPVAVTEQCMLEVQ
jgi:hypothetical protein